MNEESAENKHTFRVYVLDTAGNGGIIDEYEEADFIVSSDFKPEKESFVLEIIGNYLEPELKHKDKALVQRIAVKEGKEVNNRIIVFEYKGKKMARRLKYKSGNPVVESFTGYDKDIEIEKEEIKYLGVVTKLIERILF